jgi:hypothetical protein
VLLRATLFVAAVATDAIGSASPANAEPGGCYIARPSGDCVHYPTAAPSPPPGVTAQCQEGTYSFSERPYSGGTCHGHSGVPQHRT